MDALDAHLNAGRLDPEEYGERVGRASVARTVADLEPLFVDLPAPHATNSMISSQPGPNPAQPAPAWSAPTSVTSSEPAPRGTRNGRDPLGGRAGEVAVGLSPFIALALFLLLAHHWHEAWVFFLLIPVAGVVVYGKDHDHDRHRDRRDRRNR